MGRRRGVLSETHAADLVIPLTCLMRDPGEDLVIALVGSDVESDLGQTRWTSTGFCSAR